MPVIDCYQLYNTIKGIDVVTPNDFIKGCEMLEKVQGTIILKKLKNGTQVLCYRDYESKEHFDKFMRPFFKNKESIIQEDLVKSLGVSVNQARIMIDLYLKQGYLVTDNYIQGKSYWINELMGY